VQKNTLLVKIKDKIMTDKEKISNTNTKIKSFKDLRIWQEGIKLVKDIYLLSKKFPKDEIYGLSSQMRRCAVSIPSNIAEGFRRYHNKEYKQFLYITLGSCAELETQVIISHELEYIKEEIKEEITKKIQYICKMVSRLIQKLD
jgi:four helix bundle protein